ncbi:MAG TPA: hypothetical protein VFJ52_10365, partial [Terriglobia bacterium]|nr:hypothetical protein [Terriglobia bacterium]
MTVFRETIGLKLQVERIQPKGRGRGKVDAAVRLATRGITKRLGVEITRTVTPNNLGAIAEQVARLPQPALLAAEYVNPNMAKRLKQMNVFFLDTAGNAYLDVPGVFIYVKGQKPPVKLLTERPVRAFRPAGLKVIFVLLCKRDLLGGPYRTIAKTAGVALGIIGWIFDDLE